MIVPFSINAAKVDVLAYARRLNKEEEFFQALAEVFSDEDYQYNVAEIRSMFIPDDSGFEPLFTHIFFDRRGIMDGADLGTIQKWDMHTRTVTGEEMFNAIMSKTKQTKPTIENAAFLTKEVGLNEIQALIDICHKQGKTFWKSADDFMRFVADHEDKHVIFFSEDCGFDGDSAGLREYQVLVSYEEFLSLLKQQYSVKNPRPRFRKRRRQKPTTAKTIVRVLYTTQQVYTFKNVSNVQIIDNKVFIQHERDITEGIKESIETEIDANLVMAVVIHEVGNRSSFLRNIDNTWDFQAEDGTVINNGKQLGRIFKK
jgi:hypothetical protein|nr:MAG TPA: hypothetical protein [Caudoviricetes sp.]